MTTDSTRVISRQMIACASGMSSGGTGLREALAAVHNAYELVVKEAGLLQYEAYFTERLDRIQADLNAIDER